MIPVGFGPAARGPVEQGAATQQNTRQDAAAPVEEAPIAGDPSAKSLTAEPVTPSQAVSETSKPSENRVQGDVVALPVAEDDAEQPREPAPPEPAGPLKTYAQIPTEMVQEISRLREEAAEINAQGVPGRNDPTPMPASPDAIGTNRMPYDAA